MMPLFAAGCDASEPPLCGFCRFLFDKKGLMLLLFSNKIVKIEVLDSSGAVALTAEKNFVFPKNLDSDDDSILMIKGKNLKEFGWNEQVFAVTTLKSGERVKYAGTVTVSLDTQLNIKLAKAERSQLLEERRRYFKIKVQEKGRALFFIRGEDTFRLEEPVSIEIADINIGGIFMISPDYTFSQDDIICVEVDLFVDYKLNAMARVLRVQTTPDGIIKGYGCEFQGLTASQEDYIGRFIYKVQSEMRQKELAREDEDDS